MIWAVVLAAGASSRMTAALGPKALLHAPDGRTFLQRIADSARAGGAGGVVIVVGPPHADAIKRALPAGCASAYNPLPDRGMLSSVQAGVSTLPAACSAALVWPVDIPFVRPDTVRAILSAAPGKLVIPQHGKRGGHPIRIGRARFAELTTLDPTRGLKALVEAHPDRVQRLPTNDPGVLVDIDTPEDFARANRA